MKILPAIPESIPEVVVWLQSGGVMLHPTDTCYGFSSLMGQRTAVHAIRRLKGSEEEKPLLMIVSEEEEARKYAFFSEEAERFAKKWPAPLTLLLPKKESVPEWITNNSSVGVRVPDHTLTLELLRTLQEPLVSTSANRSGEKEMYDTQSVFFEFKETNCLFLDAGTLPHKKPSTLLKVDTESTTILREGSLRIY